MPFMIPSRFRLCELFGIPVYLDISLVILLVLFVTGGGSFPEGIASALLLLVSITAHEFGHSLTARSFGYDTRDITLSLLGGCASLIAMPRKAYQEFLTAVAGPAVSFALSLFGVALITLLAAEGGFLDALGFVWSMVWHSFGINVSFSGNLAYEASREWLMSMALYLSIMNGVLGFFNLLPGFPLDGGRVFRSVMATFMPRRNATYIAMVVGRVVAVFVGLSGVWRLFNGRSWGVVTILIAWMIWREGYREYQMSVMESSWRYSDWRD